MLFALCSMRLAFLGDEAGDCFPSSTLFEDSFPIKENSESLEKAKKFVGFQEVLGILGPYFTESPLLKEVGFEDYHASSFQSPFDFWDETSIEKVEVGDEVVVLLFNWVGVEVGKNRVDFDPKLSSQIFSFL